MAAPLWRLSATELVGLFRGRVITPADALEAVLARLEMQLLGY